MRGSSRLLSTRFLPTLTLAALTFTLAPGASLKAQETLQPIKTSHAEIRLQIVQGGFELTHSEIRKWVSRSVEVIEQFYGSFPVEELDVFIHSAGGASVRTGNMHPGPEPSVNVWVGVRSDFMDLARDWVLVHELAHTALPDIPDRHHWLEEGLAVYVESIARMHAGDLEASFVWGEFVARMPLGLPQLGDAGLDGTSSWGRTYWGGALFSFLADMRIRIETNNRKGLKDALQGILAADLNGTTRASIGQVIQAGDAATGIDVLKELYEEMRETPVDVDLEAIWRELGITTQNRRASFDDKAPKAWLRESISRASKG